MPHSVPFERVSKQSSSSPDLHSSILSETAMSKRSSSSASISSGVVSGRVRKHSSAAAHRTTSITNAVRVVSAEANVDGLQDVKAEDVMINDSFGDEIIQDMTMNNPSDYQPLWQVPLGPTSESNPNLGLFSWQESLRSNLEASETDPFLQDWSTRTLGTYRKPLPPPAFPFSRYEGWCLREKRKIYRKQRFNEIHREKDPVDRLIHWGSEKNRQKPKRQLSLYLQKLDMILMTTECLYDSYEVCKERAKVLQHEPVISSPLREHVCSAEGDEWQVAEETENFFEQWLTWYDELWQPGELYQPEGMNWDFGVQQPVSNFVGQSMDWESGVPSLDSYGQLPPMN